jgi:hypothetical protein
MSWPPKFNFFLIGSSQKISKFLDGSEIELNETKIYSKFYISYYTLGLRISNSPSLNPTHWKLSMNTKSAIQKNALYVLVLVLI